MKKTALVIMIITVISKLLGFGREILLSYFYGASGITDAYLVSLTIPGVIFSLIGVGIGTGFIPMFSRIRQQQSFL
jgi:putative peptidoglycan lipid II flippase